MPTYYQIRVQGHLDQSWSAWFDNLTIQHDPDGGTTLAGLVADQAALYGLLTRLRDAGLELVAAERMLAPVEPVRRGGRSSEPSKEDSGVADR